MIKLVSVMRHFFPRLSVLVAAFVEHRAPKIIPVAT